MKYICRIWSYKMPTTCMLSNDNESLQEFKKRVQHIYPFDLDYFHQYSKFEEI